MPHERWGSFSAIDHINPAMLVPELLLYDRLVIQVPIEGDKARWKKKVGSLIFWDKNKSVGDLAIKAYWTPHKRKKFRTKMEEFKQARFDAVNLFDANPYATTRTILAQETNYTPPLGITGFTIIPAYQSEYDFRKDFMPDNKQFLRTRYGILQAINLPYQTMNLILKKH